MGIRTAPFLALAGALALSACVVETSTPPPAAGSSAATGTQPAPPDVGFSPDVSNAAVDACRSALDAQTDGSVEVTGTEFSQANSAVYMVVGANRAPWSCLVSNNGQGAELTFIGTEGSL